MKRKYDPETLAKKRAANGTSIKKKPTEKTAEEKAAMAILSRENKNLKTNITIEIIHDSFQHNIYPLYEKMKI